MVNLQQVGKRWEFDGYSVGIFEVGGLVGKRYMDFFLNLICTEFLVTLRDVL